MAARAHRDGDLPIFARSNDRAPVVFEERMANDGLGSAKFVGNVDKYVTMFQVSFRCFKA